MKSLYYYMLAFGFVLAGMGRVEAQTLQVENGRFVTTTGSDTIRFDQLDLYDTAAVYKVLFFSGKKVAYTFPIESILYIEAQNKPKWDRALGEIFGSVAVFGLLVVYAQVIRKNEVSESESELLGSFGLACIGTFGVGVGRVCYSMSPGYHQVYANPRFALEVPRPQIQHVGNGVVVGLSVQCRF